MGIYVSNARETIWIYHQMQNGWQAWKIHITLNIVFHERKKNINYEVLEDAMKRYRKLGVSVGSLSEFAALRQNSSMVPLNVVK